MKVYLFVAEGSFFCSHWIPIANKIRGMGHDLWILTNVGDKKHCVEANGFRYINISYTRSSGGIKFLFQFVDFIRLLHADPPDVLHNVGVRPIIFGSLSCLISRKKLKVINAITGLGYIFSSSDLRARILRMPVHYFLKFAFIMTGSKVLAENDDILEYVRADLGVDKSKSFLIPGSGVNTAEFSFSPLPNGIFTVVMASRLLKDKGVYDFIEAARIVRSKIAIKMLLVGAPDNSNPSSIDEDLVWEWHEQGIIEYVGFSDDIAKIYMNSHLVILPSYAEGLPKSLTEALAVGRPVITTDTLGCREVVVNGVNGFLVQCCDPKAIANGIILLHNDRVMLEKFSIESRIMAVNKFSEEHVVDVIQRVYREYSI